jgi:MscS family membrane protein
MGVAVNSVLAIGGVGGLAVGLAGREILENLFTGLIILSSSPFEVGDEVLFSPPSGQARTHPASPT